MSDANYVSDGGPVPKNGGKKTASAREISKWSMVIASLWIGVLTLVKAGWGLVSKQPFGLEMNDIIVSGLALAAVFSPIYFSIILDKIKDIKVQR